MDSIKTRLDETAKACLEALAKWENNKKDAGAGENLRDAVHELRKVASRIEIDLVVSERDQKPPKPMPIPTHPDARKRKKSDDDNKGNTSKGQSSSDDGNDDTSSAPKRRRTSSSRSSSTSGGERRRAVPGKSE